MVIVTKFDVGDLVWAWILTAGHWNLVNTHIEKIGISIVDPPDPSLGPTTQKYVEAYYPQKEEKPIKLFWADQTFKTKEEAEAYWERIQ